VLELQKIPKPKFPEFLLVIDHGKKRGPLIPKLFGSLSVQHSGELECVVGKSSEARSSRAPESWISE